MAIISSSINVLKKTKAAAANSKKGEIIFNTPPNTQIFKSWVSWRVAFTIFLTIVVVQGSILNFDLKKIENEKLDAIRTTAINILNPALDPNITDTFSSPLAEESAKRILNKTILEGITIYSNEIDPLHPNSGGLIPLQTYGVPMALSNLKHDNLTRTFRNKDGLAYEFILRNSDLDRNYTIAVRANSSLVNEQVREYLIHSIVILLLVAAFITTILMITIGRWLLKPILFMRSNLIEASNNPENPNIEPSPFNSNDEIGNAIQITQKLIRQNAQNITQLKATAEDKINKLAYYDALTTLPNRANFLQEISKAMRPNENGETNNFAVITADLDHFKDINDSMGHNVGDAILRGVGKRLSSSLPDDALVSRAGEDEFAIMLPLTGSIKTANEAAEKIASIIRDVPFKVFNEEFQIRCSVGVAAYPRDGATHDEILKNADIALNRAKEAGRNTIKEYSEDFDRTVQARFQMLRDLRDALERDQLTLNYQPQLDLKTGKVFGAEALLRWWKPDNSKAGGSFISPAEFVPVAEQSGLIVPIGQWVLKKACEQAQKWREENGLDIRMAVNISPAQFAQGDLVAFVSKTLKDLNMPAHMLELEVTESVFMDDINHTIQTLKELHGLGVELAIDDFGTGYSSLSYLRQFPIDRLKIDQSFIRNALNNADDASIAKTIIGLGRSLNLKVIAEGVETVEHEAFLIQEGCDEVQGFRYSKPVPADKFLEFYKGYNGDLTSFARKNA